MGKISHIPGYSTLFTFNSKEFKTIKIQKIGKSIYFISLASPCPSSHEKLPFYDAN